MRWSVRYTRTTLNAQGLNAHRTDLGQELAATILHAARHVWVYRHLESSGLPRVFSRSGSAKCRKNALPGCAAEAAMDLDAIQAHEADAEGFAQRYKGYLR